MAFVLRFFVLKYDIYYIDADMFETEKGKRLLELTKQKQCRIFKRELNSL